MPTTNNLTPNRGYKEPHVDNTLPVDVQRLIDQVRTIDTDVASLLASIAGKADASALANYILTTARGVANGVAELDGTAKIPEARLPASVLGRQVFVGNWNALTNTPALPAAAAAYAGHTYKVTTAGTTMIDGNNDWKIGDFVSCVTDGGAGYVWVKTDNTDQVSSVAALQGAITASALTAALSALVGDAGAGGTKGLVPAPAAGDAAALKALLASGAWGLPAVNMTLLSEVSGVSGATVNFNSSVITSEYKELILHYSALSHNGGTDQAFELLISGDAGATYSLSAEFTNAVNAATSVAGHFSLRKSAAGVYMISSSTVAVASGHARNSGIALPSGSYINHLRLRAAVNSIDLGNLRLWGIK